MKTVSVIIFSKKRLIKLNFITIIPTEMEISRTKLCKQIACERTFHQANKSQAIFLKLVICFPRSLLKSAVEEAEEEKRRPCAWWMQI